MPLTKLAFEGQQPTSNTAGSSFLNNIVTSGGYSIDFIELGKIKKSELHHYERAKEIRHKIIKDSCWTHPVVIEDERYFIMDGHHRYDAALKMGLSHIPCVKLSYRDARVKLLSWRKEFKIKVSDIYSIESSGKLFPPKTTKHLFDPCIGTCEVPLNWLF